MKNQYKLLQEKYDEINLPAIKGAENDIKFVKDIFKFIEGITVEEAEELIHYVDTEFRKEHGFHPDGETITELYWQLVWVYGDSNGLIDRYGTNWISPNAEEKAKKHVIEKMYNGSVGKRKREAIFNKDNPGIEMDI